MPERHPLKTRGVLLAEKIDAFGNGRPPLQRFGEFAVDELCRAFHLDRVNIMIRNGEVDALEALSSTGEGRAHLLDLRTPLIRLPGISSRAVQVRSFVTGRPIIVRDRNKDKEYRNRENYPHKTFSRQFAILPLKNGRGKLGILSVAVDHNNSVDLSEAFVKEMFPAAAVIARHIDALRPARVPDHEVLQELRNILSRGLVRTFFQPIIDTRHGRILGHEALFRIKHPLFASNDKCVEYAERFNLVRDISRLVHIEAVAQLPILPPEQMIFLNFHARDFREYSKDRGRANPFTDVNLSRLVFEISERHFLNDGSGLVGILRRFKRRGARIAIDDLGRGYSSLNTLADLAPDFIKLDMGLIRAIDRDEKRRHLVQSFLTFARETGCQCIAEGVETEAELRTLIGMGCDFIQGYFFRRPNPKLWSDELLRARLAKLKMKSKNPKTKI